MSNPFTRREVPVAGVPTIYQLYEPAGSRSSEELPLILFLHGAGESGSDGLRQTTVGIGRAIKQEPERFPARVVFPQASRGYGWRGFNLDAAVAALDDAMENYQSDDDRVYITGISMGGYGTTALVLAQPERFAAAVPICGGLDLSGARSANVAAAITRMTQIPWWVLHGDADDIIPVEQSRTMVAALRAAGAEVRYTEYRGIAHNSWDRAYSDPELMRWMLEQRRS